MSTLIVFLTQKWNGKDDLFAYLLTFFPNMCFVFGLCLFVFYVHFCFVYRFASLADRRRLLLQSHKEHASFQSDFSAKSTVSRCVHKFYFKSISRYVLCIMCQYLQCNVTNVGWLSFPKAIYYIALSFPISHR